MSAQPLRLFFIGDSISIQYGPYLEKLVEGTFAYDRKRDSAGAPKATTNLDVPTGANGGDSDMVLAYLRHRLATDPIAADVVVLNCGLHDIKTHVTTGEIQVPIERYEQNLRGIIEALRGMGVRPVWINTTPVIDEIHNTRSKDFHRFARDVAAVNAAVARVMADEGVSVIDLHGFSAPHLPQGFMDHVHYTPELRERQAAFIFEELRRLLLPPTFSDVPYLGPDRAEKLDVYLPPDTFPRPLPAILLIHGGGWRICDKADARERNIGSILAAHGYAVFSINYLLNIGEKDPVTDLLKLTRLAWPQNLHDCKSALRYIRAEADRYGIDPDRIAAMGGSAGGHLSMLVGATANHAEFNRHGVHTDQRNDVACVLNFYGDYDIRGRAVSPFAGATPEETRANEEAASPVVHFDDTLPPLFISHGTADTTIPVERSRQLAEHLRAAGRDYVYIEIAGAPHSYHLQPAQYDLRPAVLAFLQKYLASHSA